ncbi:hypothetical protein [Legionella tunisiensis]|uniref:hypothetical protein n=1 Tax=Legionella tunisiensis TaxID=1034944 RepID=UPI00036676DC|nr:hypothetical protein [Legionella tunisiensis]
MRTKEENTSPSAETGFIFFKNPDSLRHKLTTLFDYILENKLDNIYSILSNQIALKNKYKDINEATQSITREELYACLENLRDKCIEARLHLELHADPALSAELKQNNETLNDTGISVSDVYYAFVSFMISTLTKRKSMVSSKNLGTNFISIYLKTFWLTLN